MRKVDEIIAKLQSESDTDECTKTPCDVYGLMCYVSIKNYNGNKILSLDNKDIRRVIANWICERLESADDCDAALSIIHDHLPITSKNTKLIKELMLKGASFINNASELAEYVIMLPHKRRYRSAFDEIYTKALSLAIKERNELEGN